MPVILSTWKAEIKRIAVQGHPGKQFVRPISKITREKWTGGVIQVVKCLLCKCEVLSSNPSPTKMKKKRKTEISISAWNQ
jgi:hypothetical protein